ncbi:MAG: hypothetical protein ACI87O_001069 [Planctomycetota bacterium]|jgi:hypothetical protein
MKRTCNKKEEGGALIFVLFGMMILVSLSAALVQTSFQRQNTARSINEQGRAFEAAMTGLDLAVFELQEGVDVVADGIGNVEGEMGGGDYLVSIVPEFGTSENYTLTASGAFGNSNQGIEMIISAENYFPYGMFGKTSLEMGGTYSIDSYNSEEGTYASQSNGTFAGDSGNLGCNGDIVAAGSTVYGDATPGPGSQVLGDPTNVTGSTAPAVVPHEFETYVYDPAIASSGSYRGTRTLSGGEYRFDALRLVGTQVLTLEGEVDLYVDGNFDISGTASIVVAPGATVNIFHGSGTMNIAGTGIVNQEALPANLTITSATTESISVSGTSAFYGLLYATESQFRSIGTSDWYGVILADTLSLSGSGFLHFDESLEIPVDLTQLRIRSAIPISTVGL